MAHYTKPRDKRMLMVVSHTHWDREWYLAYQSFRVRLVGLFDELIELFDSDQDYKHFMLDGHTIPLEDGAAATLPARPKALAARVETLREALEPLATTPYLLLMNGSDHLPPQPELPAALDAANEHIADAFMKHASLPEVFDAVSRC